MGKPDRRLLDAEGEVFVSLVVLGIAAWERYRGSGSWAMAFAAVALVQASRVRWAVRKAELRLKERLDALEAARGLPPWSDEG